MRSGSAGFILPLMLGLLGLGSILTVPFLYQMSTGVKGVSVIRNQDLTRYSAQSGLEHSRWRLHFESGFADSINQSSPTYVYNYNINNRTADINIKYVPPALTPSPTPTPSRPQSDRVSVEYSIVPSRIYPGQVTVVTITITVTNLDTSNIKFNQIGDLLPSGFTYIPGTASGFTTAEPAIQTSGGQQQLTWDFGPPIPNIPHYSSIQQIFQVSAFPPEGFYYNEAWVVFNEDAVGTVYAPHPYPIIAEYKKYDVMSKVGPVTLKSRLGKNDIKVLILSWQW